ncbi:MAG: type IV pilin protein [Pseudomonadota bacterium]
MTKLVMDARQKGITLIELLIVVTIVGILSAIVIPSYQESVRKAHRADGQAVMLELAQFMERFYTENGRYDQDRAGTPVGDFLVGSSLMQAPKSGGTIYYTMQLDNLTATTYTIRANPSNAQAGDKCGNLLFNQAGVRDVDGATAAVENCW